MLQAYGLPSLSRTTPLGSGFEVLLPSWDSLEEPADGWLKRCGLLPNRASTCSGGISAMVLGEKGPAVR